MSFAVAAVTTMAAMAMWIAMAITMATTASATPPTSVGHALYQLDADSAFDPYANETEWLRQHVDLIKGYGSFAQSHYVAKGLATIDYHDAAMDSTLSPLTPERRAAYMAKVEADRKAGFVGVFNDDVNLGMGFRDGSQNKSSYQPEASELANLVERERAYWPTAVIETNIQWHDLKARLAEHDESVKRIVRDSSLITKEFGVGPTAGITSESDYDALLDFNESLAGPEWQHTGLETQGKGMVFGADNNDHSAPTMEYDLATELLVDRPGAFGTVPGLDFINTGGEYKLLPTWWPGSNVDPGEPWARRWQPAGETYWLRRFTNALVVVDPPGHAEISLPVTCRSVGLGTVNPLRLQGAQGAVCMW